MLDNELITKIKLANQFRITSNYLETVIKEGRFKVTEDITIATHWLCLPDSRFDFDFDDDDEEQLEEYVHVTDYLLYRMYVNKAEDDEVIIFDDIRDESVAYMFHEGLYICIDDEWDSREWSKPVGDVVHMLCVADRNNGYPNFYPIGVYSSLELVEKELAGLPKNKHYQLFEIPINQFFGRIEENGSLTSGLGYLPHTNYEPEGEDDIE